MPQADRTLIFLHIHKTAGTSLRHLLVRQFPRGATLVMDQRYFRLQQALDELGALDLEARRRIACLVGHVAYGVHRLLPREPTYLTMLREPVKRTLSQYRFLRTVPAPHIIGILDGKDRLTSYERQFRDHLRAEDTPANSLEAYLDMCLASESLNLQTRMIGGFVPHDCFLPPYPPLPGNALETAKSNLRYNIAACGLVERFDESVLLMQAAFGWRNAYYMQENVTGSRLDAPSIDNATRRRIERHCALDLELYGYAQTLFAERLRAYPDLTAATLRRFRRRNGLYQGLRKAYDRSGLRQIRALVGQAFRG